MARGQTMDASYNAGLRAFMIGVYSKLTLGIALAGVLAFAAGTIEPLTALIFGTPLYYVVMIYQKILRLVFDKILLFFQLEKLNKIHCQ